MGRIRKRLMGLSLELENTKWITGMLFIINFSDASLLPLPAQAFLLLVIFTYPAHTVKYLTVCFIGAVTGGLAGYFLGWLTTLSSTSEASVFFRILLKWIPGFSENAYLRIQNQFSEMNLWVLLSTSVAPIPYGLVAITSGIFKINFINFLFVTILTQSVKFYGVTFIAAKLGHTAFEKIKHKLMSFTTIGLICIAIVILVSLN